MPLNIVNSEDFFTRGIVAHSAGRYPEAEKLYRQVLSMSPNHVGAFQNLGVLAFQVGRNDAAIPLLRKAAELAPDNAAIYCNMGDAYTAMRQGDEALACYQKAVQLDPNMATIYNNLGIVYSRLGRVEDAINSWLKAIELSAKPIGQARVLVGMGGGGTPGAATPGAEQRMLGAAAYNNLGNAYLQQISLDKALECHRKAVEMNPDYANARSNMLRDFTHIPNLDTAMLLEEHKKWWTIHGAGITPLLHNNTRDPNRKLRVGFVSPDFREHSVTHFLLAIFENYDRSKFDLYCYSGVMRPDEYTNRLAACTPNWRNSLGADDPGLAKIIHDDKIDILIDLSGHTSDHRLRVFAFKPAPVQVTYLGYPMTTGATVIDYRIADPICDPPGMTDSQYSEKVWRLPTTMWCYRPPVNIPAEELPPTQRGKSPFVFGSFNNCSKISGLTFKIWAGALKAVPGSKMMVKASAMADANTRKQVEMGFAKEGIAADRLILVQQQLNLSEHFAYYANVDLALDTYTYNGTTTTCEALWMNVPVLTIAGDMHISRVGASLLTNVGLGDLVAKDENDFVEIAARLAKNPDELMKYRTNLRQKFRESPVMNAPKFAAEFGEALREMWRIWCAEPQMSRAAA